MIILYQEYKKYTNDCTQMYDNQLMLHFIFYSVPYGHKISNYTIIKIQLNRACGCCLMDVYS